MELLATRGEQGPSVNADWNLLGLTIHNHTRVLLIYYGLHLVIGKLIVLACVRLPIPGLSSLDNTLVHLLALIYFLMLVPIHNFLAFGLHAGVQGGVIIFAAINRQSFILGSWRYLCLLLLDLTSVLFDL
jgi:hypothetical protein